MFLLVNNENLEIKKAISFKDRLYGLMGKKNINYGMLFDKCNSIHTFFMKENIDIIGLNQNNTVIYKYENIYFVEFIYNNVNYDIETDGINIVELEMFLKSIIK